VDFLVGVNDSLVGDPSLTLLLKALLMSLRMRLNGFILSLAKFLANPNSLVRSLVCMIQVRPDLAKQPKT